MNAPRLSSRFRQQGMVGVMAVILLITAVIFVLAQTLGMSGSNSIDNRQQRDSVAALFMAESGVEKGLGSLWVAADPSSTSACSSFSGEDLGAVGKFTLNGSASGCNADTPPRACSSCSIESTGTVNTASRKIRRNINLATVNGTAGYGTSVTPPLDLRNTYNVGAVGVFNLAWDRQVQGSGNADATACSGCTTNWETQGAGANAIGSMGSVYQIASQASKSVTQTISIARNYVEVGGLFPGLSSAPTVLGSYWNDKTGTNPTVNTNAQNPGAGGTNNGVAVSPYSSASDTPVAFGSQQANTSWCSGGDTLVFGVSNQSAAATDGIQSIVFNSTNGAATASSTSMQNLVHYPSADGTTRNASYTVYSELWYAYNSAYQSSAKVASSYKGNGTGAIGTAVTKGAINDLGTTLDITAGNAGISANTFIYADPTNGDLGFVSYKIGSTQYTYNFKITGFTSGVNGGKALYAITPIGSSVGNVPPNLSTRGPFDFNTASRVLNVVTCVVCFFDPSTNDSITGTNISGSYNITSSSLTGSGGAGRYLLNGYYGGGAVPAYNNNYPIAAYGAVKAGTPGATIYLPSTSSVPAYPTTPPTKVAVSAGTGQFAAATTVASVSSVGNSVTNYFSVSVAPTVALDGATICGGICALLNQPYNPNSSTEFTVTVTGSKPQWAGGFICLSGVDYSKIATVTSTMPTAGIWYEVVQ